MKLLFPRIDKQRSFFNDNRGNLDNSDNVDNRDNALSKAIVYIVSIVVKKQHTKGVPNVLLERHFFSSPFPVHI